jgi:alkylation response protein AidB-like acyl-CoA dehydrogenase
MNFQYTEEQQLMADSVARLADEFYDFEARKRIVGSEAGYSPEVWARLAELGLLALSLPAEQGGFDGGALDLVATMEAIGAALMVEPFVPTIGLGARIIARAGSAAQRAQWLPGVADGSTILALAHDETQARYDLEQVATRAERDGAGWRLTGSKSIVIGAPIASHLIVSARTSGEPGDARGLSLFILPAASSGLRMKVLRTQDNHRAADLELRGVGVGPEFLIGREGQALEVLEEAIDFATVLSCAEAVGAMKSANTATLEYLKTRRQFGVPIGSFQALQHRLVDMYMSAEQARSITLLACSRVDAAARGEIAAAERSKIVAAAKLKISDASRHVGQEAVQLHGGMGMTQEMKVAHTFKRLTMLGQQFGDADHQLERYAALG